MIQVVTVYHSESSRIIMRTAKEQPGFWKSCSRDLYSSMSLILYLFMFVEVNGLLLKIDCLMKVSARVTHSLTFIWGKKKIWKEWLNNNNMKQCWQRFWWTGKNMTYCHEDMVLYYLRVEDMKNKKEKKKKQVEEPFCRWLCHLITNVEGQWTVYCLLLWKKQRPSILAVHLNTKSGIITITIPPFWEMTFFFFFNNILNNALKKMKQRMWNKHQYVSGKKKKSTSNTAKWRLPSRSSE